MKVELCVYGLRGRITPHSEEKKKAIWVIVDKLTKIVHFIAMRNT